MMPKLPKFVLAGALGVALVAPALPAQENFRYQWQRVFYGAYQGQEALLYSASAFRGKPSLGDLDGDGDLDLLVGKLDGRLNRYENVGTPTTARWRLVEEDVAASIPMRVDGITRREFRRIDLGSNAAPALVDIDQDGDLDLFVGAGDGRLYFFQNTGTELLPEFAFLTDKFVRTVFGKKLTPFFSDINGDRAPDLFIGNEKGQVFLLVNQGNRQRAVFCSAFPSKFARPEEPPPCRPAPRLLVALDRETHAAPALVDWDGDGDKDLFVGKRDGTIAYYENQGTPFEGNWQLEQSRFLAIDSGGYAAPEFMDINGDGQPDLISGNGANNLFAYTNLDTGRVLDVWKVTDNLLLVARVGQGRGGLTLASGDLDGDGDLDLVVGDRAGHLAWLENTGSKAEPAWRIVTSELLPGARRENTAPALADVDQDGDLDLLVGGKDGRIWLIRNNGDSKAARWRLENNLFGGVDVGSNSVPALTDLDKDGDLDLLVGNGRGLVIFYRNVGSATVPRFRLANTNFAGISVGRNAAPAFFDWNADKLPDLIVGNRVGRLALAVNLNSNGDADLRNWRLQSMFWEAFQVGGFSIPHINDFNGDEKPDLMIGDEEGNLLFWYNGGFEKSGTAVAAVPARPSPLPPQFSRGAVLAVPPPEIAVPGPTDSLTDLAALLRDSGPTGPVPPAYTLVSRTYGGIQVRGKAAPAFADLDGDGDLDLLVGTGNGQLVEYRNDGTLKEAKWSKVSDNFSGIPRMRNAVPVFVDLDGDGFLDLLVGSETGRVFFYQNVSKVGGAKFVFREGALTEIKVGRNAAPALIPANGGKTIHLVIGSLSGHLFDYVRAADQPGGKFRRISRRFLGLDVGVSSSPFVGDMDRDGVLDLIFGSDQGNLLNYQRISVTVKNPGGWQKGPGYLDALKFPPGTTPRLADIDGDGDQDLFVGAERGTIYFYRNNAELPGAGTVQ